MSLPEDPAAVPASEASDNSTVSKQEMTTSGDDKIHQQDSDKTASHFNLIGDCLKKSYYKPTGRPVGRPRKNSAPNTTDQPPTTPKPTGNQRGRPRKYPDSDPRYHRRPPRVSQLSLTEESLPSTSTPVEPTHSTETPTLISQSLDTTNDIISLSPLDTPTMTSSTNQIDADTSVGGADIEATPTSSNMDSFSDSSMKKKRKSYYIPTGRPRGRPKKDGNIPSAPRSPKSPSSPKMNILRKIFPKPGLIPLQTTAEKTSSVTETPADSSKKPAILTTTPASLSKTPAILTTTPATSTTTPTNLATTPISLSKTSSSGDSTPTSTTITQYSEASSAHCDLDMTCENEVTLNPQQPDLDTSDLSPPLRSPVKRKSYYVPRGRPRGRPRSISDDSIRSSSLRFQSIKPRPPQTSLAPPPVPISLAHSSDLSPSNVIQYTPQGAQYVVLPPDVTTDTSTSQNTVSPVKRARGRPRIHPKPPEWMEKKSRGRPRIHPRADDVIECDLGLNEEIERLRQLCKNKTTILTRLQRQLTKLN